MVRLQAHKSYISVSCICICICICMAPLSHVRMSASHCVRRFSAGGQVYDAFVWRLGLAESDFESHLSSRSAFNAVVVPVAVFNNKNSSSAGRIPSQCSADALANALQTLVPHRPMLPVCSSSLSEHVRGVGGPRADLQTGAWCARGRHVELHVR